MIADTYYKDRPAVKVESGRLRALFLPEDGAKLASLIFDGREYLEQAPGETYLRLGRESDYVACECSAFDDMFPTIDSCRLDGHTYPDHGEVCRIPHAVSREGDAVRFSCAADSVNARFTKRARAEGDRLLIDYRIENLNEAPLDCLWAGHMMFRGEEGARAVDCFGPGAARRIMFGEPEGDLSVLGPFSPDGASWKYYVEAAAAPLSCGVAYPDGRKVTVSFRGDAVRYLGVWINRGSFKGMYNVALEPCTAPYDSPVNANGQGKGFSLPPLGACEFRMEIGFALPA